MFQSPSRRGARAPPARGRAAPRPRSRFQSPSRRGARAPRPSQTPRRIPAAVSVPFSKGRARATGGLIVDVGSLPVSVPFSKGRARATNRDGVDRRNAGQVSVPFSKGRARATARHLYQVEHVLLGFSPLLEGARARHQPAIRPHVGTVQRFQSPSRRGARAPPYEVLSTGATVDQFQSPSRRGARAPLCGLRGMRGGGWRVSVPFSKGRARATR